MKGERMDHRVRLTKQIIRDTLVQLMGEFPISRISVKMLCESAGINRSTFYAHYSDPYDLLHQIQQDVIEKISAYISEDAFAQQSQMTVDALKRILDYAQENAALLKVLLSNHGDYGFRAEIMQLVQQKVIQEIDMAKRVEQNVSDYMQIFVVTGAVSVIHKWLNNGMPETTQEMAALCFKLLYTGLTGIFA